MTLKKNKAGQPVVPQLKPKSEKAWLTVQMDRQFRNTVTRLADKLNLNVSKYVRKKLADLVDAAKYGKIPADAAEMAELVCSKCQAKLDS
jgi:hypothetical protein